MMFASADGGCSISVVLRIVVNAGASGGVGTAAALGAAVAALGRGGVVAYPTETFYGLGADPRSDEAVARVFAAKHRPADQLLPLIAADTAQVAGIGEMTPLAERLAARWWPGPLTLVIPASRTLSAAVHLSTGKVAVRVPDHAIARALAAAAGHALTSTSANISGQPPLATADEVASMLSDSIDVLIDGGRTPGGRPSTIVDVTGGAPELIREGAVAWERVLEFLSSA
jgi:L-threonylcarbamoyladenylate synthase